MNRNTKIVTVMIAVVSLAAGSTVLAKGWSKNHGERMINRISNHLSLDEGQQAALQAFSSEISEVRELMRQGDLRSEMTNLMSSESFDQAGALELINQRTATIELQAPDIVSAAAVFFDGLSPEQREKLTARMEKMGKHHRK